MIYCLLDILKFKDTPMPSTIVVFIIFRISGKPYCIRMQVELKGSLLNNISVIQHLTAF